MVNQRPNRKKIKNSAVLNFSWWILLCSIWCTSQKKNNGFLSLSRGQKEQSLVRENVYQHHYNIGAKPRITTVNIGCTNHIVLSPCVSYIKHAVICTDVSHISVNIFLIRICWSVGGWCWYCMSDCCAYGLAGVRRTAVKWQLL